MNLFIFYVEVPLILEDCRFSFIFLVKIIESILLTKCSELKMINGETLLYCLQFATFVQLLLSPPQRTISVIAMPMSILRKTGLLIINLLN